MLLCLASWENQKKSVNISGEKKLPKNSSLFKSIISRTYYVLPFKQFYTKVQDYLGICCHQTFQEGDGFCVPEIKMCVSHQTKAKDVKLQQKLVTDSEIQVLYQQELTENEAVTIKVPLTWHPDDTGLHGFLSLLGFCHFSSIMSTHYWYVNVSHFRILNHLPPSSHFEARINGALGLLLSQMTHLCTCSMMCTCLAPGAGGNMLDSRSSSKPALHLLQQLLQTVYLFITCLALCGSCHVLSSQVSGLLF